MPCIFECTYRCTGEGGEEIEATIRQNTRCSVQWTNPQRGECVLVRERQIPDDGTTSGLLIGAMGALLGAGLGFFIGGFGGPAGAILGAIVGGIIGGAAGTIAGVLVGKCP